MRREPQSRGEECSRQSPRMALSFDSFASAHGRPGPLTENEPVEELLSGSGARSRNRGRENRNKF
eukprot:6716337-Prymnesium_polylepis.2